MNSEQLRANAIAQLNIAIELIGEADKADYLVALRIAPQLVVTESDPYRFLLFADFNPWAAAHSLTNYWKRRREIFGSRAFLPMALTGNSALSPQDIEFIKAGSMVFLPSDAHGRPVFCVDTRRMDYPVEVRMRSGFYIHQILSEDPASQTKGHSILVLVRKLPRKQNGPNIRSVIMPIFPIKSRSFHMFNCLPYWPNNSLLGSFMEGLVNIFQDLFMNHRTCVHASQRKEEIIPSMNAHGFRTDGLPVCIGGSWKYENFQLWLANRAILEQERYKDFNIGGTPQQHSIPEVTDEDHPIKKRRIHSPTTNGGGVQGSRDQTQELCEKMLKHPRAQTYKDALRVGPPEIWMNESNLGKFLQVEKFDLQLAADRLSRYWNLRSKIFGAKRFDSMHQTGEAALGRKDLSVLVTGFAQLLQNDSSGCSVLYVDGCRVPEGSVDANRDRCLFYMFSLLAENIESQKEGAVLIYCMDSCSVTSLAPDTLKRFASSLPLKFKAVHLVSPRRIPADTTGHMSFGNQLFIHIGIPKEEMCSKFETYGLNKKGLPHCLNGDWGYSKFIQWQELRTRMEWKVPLGLSGRESIEEFPTLRRFNALPDSEKVERSRRLNVMHCRRKKYRILVETDILREKSKELEEEQGQLKDKNRRLEGLMEAATALIEKHDKDQGV